jgi:hypothetical protein
VENWGKNEILTFARIRALLSPYIRDSRGATPAASGPALNDVF